MTLYLTAVQIISVTIVQNNTSNELKKVVLSLIAGKYIQHVYESCLEVDMLPSNRRLLIRTCVTYTVLLAFVQHTNLLRNFPAPLIYN